MKVELISYTPNPVEHCACIAGISCGKAERKDPSEFIKKLVEIGHLGVLEHANFTFRVEGVSRALTHQWVRHRVCSFLQRSQRRVNESMTNFVYPSLDYIQDDEWWGGVKEISLGSTKREHLQQELKGFCLDSLNGYRYLLEHGVKPEDARYVLPNATQTQAYWTINARALRHYFKLRLHKATQWEHEEMAKKMFDLVACYQCSACDEYLDGTRIKSHWEMHDATLEDLPSLKDYERTLLRIPPALPFFEDLMYLRRTGEYSGHEGGLE